MTVVTRRELGQLSGGAVALGGTIAFGGYAAAQLPQTDPALEIAAEWTTARDNLRELLKDMRRSEERSRQWRANAIALEDASDRLSQIAPTTLAGAAALLAIAVFTLQPDGLVRVHHGFIADMPVLEWLQRAHGAIAEIGAAS